MRYDDDDDDEDCFSQSEIDGSMNSIVFVLLKSSLCMLVCVRPVRGEHVMFDHWLID